MSKINIINWIKPNISIILTSYEIKYDSSVLIRLSNEPLADYLKEKKPEITHIISYKFLLVETFLNQTSILIS